MARRSAVRARNQAMNHIRGLLVSAPAMLREQVAGLDRAVLIRTLARLRPGDDLSHPLAATRASLRRLTRRHEVLDEEIAQLDREIEPLVKQATPALLKLFGVGPETAGQPLTSAGDNPERMRSEAASRTWPGSPRSLPPPGAHTASGSTAAATGGEQRPAHHRPGPPALQRTRPPLRRTPHQRRAQQKGHHGLPQAIRRPRGLSRSDRHANGTNHSNRPRSYSLTSTGASAVPREMNSPW